MGHIGVIAHLLTYWLTSLDIQVFVTFSQAERVVVLMGSSAKTAEETVDFLRHQGEKAWYRGGGIFLGGGFKYIYIYNIYNIYIYFFFVHHYLGRFGFTIHFFCNLTWTMDPDWLEDVGILLKNGDIPACYVSLP